MLNAHRPDGQARQMGRTKLPRAGTHTHRHTQPDTHAHRHTHFILFTKFECVLKYLTATHTHSLTIMHILILTHSYTNSYSLLNTLILILTFILILTLIVTLTLIHSSHGKRQYAAYAGHHLCLPPESSANCNC